MFDYYPLYQSETLDYRADLTRFLAPGESVVSADVTVQPATLTVVQVTYDATGATARLSGGTGARGRYQLHFHVRTSSGRVKTVPFGIISLDDTVTVDTLPRITASGGIVYAKGDVTTYPAISVYDLDVVANAGVAPTTGPEISVLDAAVVADQKESPTPTFHTLSTSGVNIVDDVTGKTVKLKSVNWFGCENTNLIPDGIWQVSYKALLNQVASWGFNCLRIPFSGDTFVSGAKPKSINTSVTDNHDFILSGDPTDTTSTIVFKDTIDCMDIIVNYAASIGLMVIFDHHRRASGTGTDGAPTDSTYTEASWHATWTLVASHYASFSNVIGADVHNEPYQVAWADWVTLVEGCATAIHAVAPNWLIFVEGVGTYNNDSTWWGGNFLGVKDTPVVLGKANKLVYSPHEYGQSVGTQAWLQTDTTTVENWPTNLSAIWDKYWGFLVTDGIAPVWIGEFGGKFGVDGTGTANQANATPEKQWAGELMSYINTKGINWSYWCLNPDSSDTGGLLQDDWVTPQSTKIELLQTILT